MKRSAWWGLLLVVPLLAVFFAVAAEAGTNAGFTASITSPVPPTLKDPSIGQAVTLVISVANVTDAKQALVEIKYDTAVVGNVQITPGAFFPQPFIPLAGGPTVGTDGLAMVNMSGAQLGAPRSGRGAGVLATVTFNVTGEVPVAGSFVSVTQLQVNKSAQDKDILTYDTGRFGIALSKTVRYTLSGTVSTALGDTAVGAMVSATRNRGAADEQTVTAFSAARGAYTLTAEPDTYLVVVAPPPGRPELRVTPASGEVRLTQNLQLNLILNALVRNQISNLSVVRGHDKADITWFTSMPGLNDTLRYRAEGQTAWQTAVNPLNNRAMWLEGREGYDPRASESWYKGDPVSQSRAWHLALMAQIGWGRYWELTRSGSSGFLWYDDFLDFNPGYNNPEFPEISEPEGRSLVEERELQPVGQALEARRHAISLTGLTANTVYEFQIVSVSLNDQSSGIYPGSFTTRQGPDVRPLVGTGLDIQPSTTRAAIHWFTNRPANTRVVVEELGTDGTAVDTAFALTADSLGTQVHGVAVDSLKSATRYRASMRSRLPDGDALVASRGMTEGTVTTQFVREFRTRRATPLRFVGPVQRKVGPDEVRIGIELNQPALVAVHFDSAATSRSDAYADSVVTTEDLPDHEIILSGLVPATEYRFRVTAWLANAPAASGDSPLNSTERISTDRRGNEQWSRDLRFKTSALTDVQPPVIVMGPQVKWRDKVATIHWATDVPTTGKVFYGTWATGNITLGTANEYEAPDLGPNNKLEFGQVHRVTIPALTPGENYGYRIESVAGNGQKVVFDPLANPASAKLARVAQPPGGAGRFTTDLNPDTQWPVILSGPTISSKTHDTAVIEWSTDEPADSEVNFGIGATDEAATSGDDETSHKIVLTNLTPGTSYSYLVGSTDASGNGATESAEAAFTTNPELDLTAPRITEGPEVVYKNDRSATIRWSTDEDATTELEYGPTSSLGFVRASSTTGRTHEVSLTNLTAGTQYYYQVASTDLSGNGPTESAVVSFTTDAQADLDPPIVLLDSVAVTDVSAIVTWTTDEMSNSYVEYGTDSTNLSANIGEPEDVLEHEITLTNLTRNTKYYFRAGSVDRANNPPGESDLDSLVTLATPDRTPPAVPTALTGVPGNRQIELSWTSVPELDLNGFNVYRKSGTASYTKVASGLRQSSYVDLTVANGTAYAYQVTAVDRQNPPNESARSDSVSVTPVATAAPSPPTGLTVDQGTDYLQPTFLFTNSRPISTGGTLTYTIQVSSTSDFSDVTASVSGVAQVGASGTGQTSWQITRALNDGATYYWRVRAVEGSQLGEFTSAQQYVAREAVALPGDFDGNGAVQFEDFFLFVDAFGQAATGANAVFDLDADASIGFGDFFIFVDNFGRTASGKRWSAATETDPRAIVSLQATGGAPADQGRVLLRVQAAQVEAVKAFGLVLRYNPEAVELVRTEPGATALLASQGGQAPLFQVLAQRPGEVAIGSGLTEGAPVSGEGQLAELSFQVIGSANDAWFEVVEALVSRSASEIKRVGQMSGTVLRPQTFYLRANFPNPFNPTTTIEYGLAEATTVELAVYDILGQRVRTLVHAPSQAAGFYSATWDGLDQAGKAVGTGIYFYRLQTPQVTRTQRMTLLK